MASNLKDKALKYDGKNDIPYDYVMAWRICNNVKEKVIQKSIAKFNFNIIVKELINMGMVGEQLIRTKIKNIKIIKIEMADKQLT